MLDFLQGVFAACLLVASLGLYPLNKKSSFYWLLVIATIGIAGLMVLE